MSLMSKNVVIIGAGINGLVAANYLQKDGFKVTVLERSSVAGGACVGTSIIYKGKKYVFNKGATVLGYMQDFVFRETGLAKVLTTYVPDHPYVCYFEGDPYPYLFGNDLKKLRKEVDELGDINGFAKHLKKVRKFLIEGFRAAKVPTIIDANGRLGQKVVQLWILGSGRELLDTYFTSAKTKRYFGYSLVENSTSEMDEPYNSFNIPLREAGSVFDGNWGYVNGGISNVTKQLCKINGKLGVKLITSAKVKGLSEERLEVNYEKNGRERKIIADYLIFATDPLTAAKLYNKDKFLQKVSKKRFEGSTGKIVMFFKNNVRWKDSDDTERFDDSFRLFFLDYDNKKKLPHTIDIYCEGAALRKLGERRGYDTITAFFKGMKRGKTAKEVRRIKSELENLVLSKIANSNDFIFGKIYTPDDIKTEFLFPGGNLDHMELCEGQMLFDRNFSPRPKENFYQFGDNEKVFYCAAGSYPRGTVAGTAGYMCAKQIIKKEKQK